MVTHPRSHHGPAGRLAALRRLSLFAGLAEADLRLVDACSCEVDIPAGTVFIKQGQVAREAFFVTQGEAVVSVDGRCVARIGPGEPVGEMALLDGVPRSATVTALTPMRVLVMDPGQFGELVRDANIAHNLNEVESRRRGAARLHPVSG
jgi:CRP-like cAMP-binding protein